MKLTLPRWRGRLTADSARLPQITTPIEVSDHLSAGGHTFALVEATTSKHYTVLLDVRGSVDRFSELFSHQAVNVGAHAPDVTAVTAVCETAPSSTDGYRQWVMAPGHHHLNLTDIGVRAHVAITFAALTDATRNDAAEMGVEVGARLPRLISSLIDTGMTVRPLHRRDVVDLLCAAYNETGDTDDVTVAALGPTGDSHRTRELFCHDGFVSSSWTAAPHVLDFDVVNELAAPSIALPRKRLALTYRSTRLADDVEPNDPVVLQHRAAPQLRLHGAICTVTEPLGRGPSIEPLRAQLPLYGRLGLRKGYDRHAELFAAGLGIGVLLPDHGEIRDEALTHRHPSAGAVRLQESS